MGADAECVWVAPMKRSLNGTTRARRPCHVPATTAGNIVGASEQAPAAAVASRPIVSATGAVVLRSAAARRMVPRAPDVVCFCRGGDIRQSDRCHFPAASYLEGDSRTYAAGRCPACLPAQMDIPKGNHPSFNPPHRRPRKRRTVQPTRPPIRRSRKSRPPAGSNTPPPAVPAHPVRHYARDPERGRCTPAPTPDHRPSAAHTVQPQLRIPP